MANFNLPGAGPDFQQAIGRHLRQKLSFIWRLWTVTTANLPPATTDNEGGLVYDETTSRLSYSDGSAWQGVMPYTAGAALTRTNDTNVTVTLGGSPNTALLAATSLTLGWSGTLDVTRGGTGRATSTTAYGLIAAGTTATGAHQTLAVGATTEILVGGGASALPVWTTATGTGAPARAGSPTFTGTVSAAAVTMTGTLTLTAASMQIDNNQYIYGKTSAAASTRLIGINSSNACFVGSVDQTVASINFSSGGSNWGALTSTGFNILTGMVYRVNNVQVVAARQTGWSAATGTATRSAIATYSAPTISSPPTQAEVQAIADALQAWSRRTKALGDDLATHGLIGT